MKEQAVQLAKAVLKAAELREASYVPSDKGANIVHGIVLQSPGKYELTHEEAAKKACEVEGIGPELATPVFLLIYCGWNDAIDWAYETLGIDREEGD